MNTKKNLNTLITTNDDDDDDDDDDYAFNCEYNMCVIVIGTVNVLNQTSALDVLRTWRIVGLQEADSAAHTCVYTIACTLSLGVFAWAISMNRGM